MKQYVSITDIEGMNIPYKVGQEVIVTQHPWDRPRFFNFKVKILKLYQNSCMVKLPKNFPEHEENKGVTIVNYKYISLDKKLLNHTNVLYTERSKKEYVGFTRTNDKHPIKALRGFSNDEQEKDHKSKEKAETTLKPLLSPKTTKKVELKVKPKEIIKEEPKPIEPKVKPKNPRTKVKPKKTAERVLVIKATPKDKSKLTYYFGSDMQYQKFIRCFKRKIYEKGWFRGYHYEYNQNGYTSEEISKGAITFAKGEKVTVTVLDEFIRKYLKHNVSMYEISKLLGVTFGQIQNRIMDLGLKVNRVYYVKLTLSTGKVVYIESLYGLASFKRANVELLMEQVSDPNKFGKTTYTKGVQLGKWRLDEVEAMGGYMLNDEDARSVTVKTLTGRIKEYEKSQKH